MEQGTTKFIARFLKASTYDFVSDGGDRITGTKVSLITGEIVGNDNQAGAQFDAYNVDTDMWEKLRNFSALQKVEVTYTGLGKSMKIINVMPLNNKVVDK